jgi:hypothetical protein
MSVGFGFSVGDFLATLKLVGTIIDALRESSHSSAAFQELLNEFEAFETALNHVKRIDFDSSQQFEKVALHQAAAQCQRAIDAFWIKIQKYQPHLSKAGTSSQVKDGWAKIKWAVCKKKEVDNFRVEIRAHTSSIQLLMDAIQAKNQQMQYKSLGGKIQEFYFQTMRKLRAIADDVTQNAQDRKSLLQTCAETLKTNLRVFQMVYDINLFITRIPGQVQRQQPVYMVDAFNRESPFHLEFIRSPEALVAVLKANLKDTDCGPRMIDEGEFVIEESGTNNVIDITRNWENCFYPGQKVAMSMVFRKEE